jgi:hypothetical protein
MSTHNSWKHRSQNLLELKVIQGQREEKLENLRNRQEKLRDYQEFTEQSNLSQGIQSLMNSTGSASRNTRKKSTSIPSNNTEDEIQVAQEKVRQEEAEIEKIQAQIEYLELTAGFARKENRGALLETKKEIATREK